MIAGSVFKVSVALSLSAPMGHLVMLDLELLGHRSKMRKNQSEGFWKASPVSSMYKMSFTFPTSSHTLLLNHLGIERSVLLFDGLGD